MVRLMGGEVEVESEVGKGTVFRFALPMKEVAAGQGRKESGVVLGLDEGQGQPKVLVVDDRADNRDLLRELFTGWGFEVREAVDGQDGVDVWESWKPDVVWMDLRMPRLDGPEAVKRIRAREAELGLTRTPIFALSASVLETERGSVIAAGFDEFIFKPFKEAQLAEALEKYTGVRFRRKETEKEKEKEKEEAGVPKAETLKPLPEEWKVGFRTALLLGDSDEALRFLGELEDRSLARRIEPLIQGYRFEELLQMMDNLPNIP
jgi:CheY-like chemotaxis protein